MALTTHERLIDTPRPLYMCLRKNCMRGESTFSPFECKRELRWYMLLAESMGSVGVEGQQVHSRLDELLVEGG